MADGLGADSEFGQGIQLRTATTLSESELWEENFVPKVKNS